MHPNSLNNLIPGSKVVKHEGRRTTVFLSKPARKAAEILGKVLSGDKRGSRTAGLEALPRLILLLEKARQELPPGETRKLLEAMHIQGVAKQVATLDVLGDDDGDCLLCGSTGYERQLDPNVNCIACEGKGDFLANDSDTFCDE